ncbi:hypothetical protein [Sporolactobacillus pectinivorans]|uniref:hypothetical protein n=1 Tax=Sporolactobacillus pectinivorans TaxID=1591408 RepID=UPI000C25A62E|nr:hypothetical protein [Sporolactobacillus pectinivorans]
MRKTKTVDEFIASGLAPTFDDLNLSLGIHLDEISSLKIASKLNISDSRLMEDLDKYRKRIALLAETWVE